MRPVQLLFDEHVDLVLLTALRRHAPGAETLRVGQFGAPPFETGDPELLAWCEVEGWQLVTKDRNTMIRHFNDHLASGRHSAGVFLLKAGSAFRSCLDDLLAIVGASSADDWIDALQYLPFPRV